MDSQVDVELDSALEGRLEVTPLEQAALQALEAHGNGRTVELTVVVTTDDMIADYNRRYLGRDCPTDVLAFGTEPSVTGDGFIGPPVERAYLGDVMVSYDRAVEQATEYGHSELEELHQLIVHGVLHLLGYDDATEEERARMREMEKEVLARLGER